MPVTKPLDDHESDLRFGVHGYECLALYQSWKGDHWIGYIWVPSEHAYAYVSSHAGMPWVLARVAYDDVKLGRPADTLRLETSTISGYHKFSDQVSCVLTLTDCAAALRAMAERNKASNLGGARDTWLEPTSQPG